MAVMVTTIAFLKPYSNNKAVGSSAQNVSFVIYKDFDYQSAAYKNTFVKVKIQIEKVDGRSRTAVWSRELASTELSQLPQLSEAEVESLAVAMKDSKEHIELTYTTTYETQGAELSMSSTKIVDGNGCVKIGI